MLKEKPSSKAVPMTDDGAPTRRRPTLQPRGDRPRLLVSGSVTPTGSAPVPLEWSPGGFAGHVGTDQQAEEAEHRRARSIPATLRGANSMPMPRELATLEIGRGLATRREAWRRRCWARLRRHRGGGRVVPGRRRASPFDRISGQPEFTLVRARVPGTSSARFPAC